MVKKTIFVLFILLVGAFAFYTNEASAHHSWDGYHWARTANPFTLKLGDNLSSAWDAYAKIASKDWSLSSVLNTSIVKGLTNSKNCQPVLGRVELCNSKYGSTGWLGLTSIWVNAEHITHAVVKMNDTYFTTRTYNTPAWRQLVICHEMGHSLGLDHQDEDFSNANLGTCIDYTSIPATNQHPNAHDYEELEAIYSHLDSVSTLSAIATFNNSNKAEIGNGRGEWGKAIKKDRRGKDSVFRKNLGENSEVITHVFWIEE